MRRKTASAIFDLNTRHPALTSTKKPKRRRNRCVFLPLFNLDWVFHLQAALTAGCLIVWVRLVGVCVCVCVGQSSSVCFPILVAHFYAQCFISCTKKTNISVPDHMTKHVLALQQRVPIPACVCVCVCCPSSHTQLYSSIGLVADDDI